MARDLIQYLSELGFSFVLSMLHLFFDQYYLFQWNGSEANRIEKGKAMDIAKSIKDKERVGARVVIAGIAPL